MTAQEIADRYRASQKPESIRLAAAKKLAERTGVPWAEVEALLNAVANA